MADEAPPNKIKKSIANYFTKVTESSANDDIPKDLGESEPAQPDLLFPKSQFGGQTRAFNKEWYKMFIWIEYSEEKNCAFCFACRKYSNKNLEAKFIDNWI